MPPRPRMTSAETTDQIPHTRRSRENGLKLDFTGIVPLNTVVDTASTYIPSPYSAKLIRKKSGELVKPALKYVGPLTASGTPITERSPPLFPEDSAESPGYSARSGSKSLPGTPGNSKNVHFDSQLERVKLFNKDHKPQVVSRDGSPTQYTTSEGEEFPFPSTDDEATGKAERVLSIKLPNFPSNPDTYSDLQLESLTLDETDRKTLRGVVTVRNFAFTKWVAVRFTFDWWQTTSEVSATHKETIRDGAYDRFAFNIKLGDMMSKIEEKTLFMCVRYNSEGREIWDSNQGQNYQVNFEKQLVDKPVKRMNAWGAGRHDGRMADLREKLSRLSAEDEPLQLSPNRAGLLSPGKRGVNFSFGGSPNGSPRKGFSSLPSDDLQGIPNQGLAARYDFGSAFKGVREGRSSSPDTRNVDLPNVKTGLLAFESPNRVERPGMDFYSPQYKASGLPDTHSFGSASDFFAPPTSSKISDSPAVMSGSNSRMESPLPVPAPGMTISLPTPLAVPDLHIQGPSPPPSDMPVPIPSQTKPRSPVRPTFGRSSTSPAIITTSLPSPIPAKSPASPLSRTLALDPTVSRSPSPPILGTRNSATSTEASDSPRSPEQSSLAGIQDMSLSKFVATRERGSGDSMASYSSFIEQ